MNSRIVKTFGWMDVWNSGQRPSAGTGEVIQHRHEDEMNNDIKKINS